MTIRILTATTLAALVAMVPAVDANKPCARADYHPDEVVQIRVRNVVDYLGRTVSIIKTFETQPTPLADRGGPAGRSGVERPADSP
jgi:hypothetical protein